MLTASLPLTLPVSLPSPRVNDDGTRLMGAGEALSLEAAEAVHLVLERYLGVRAGDEREFSHHQEHAWIPEYRLHPSVTFAGKFCRSPAIHDEHGEVQRERWMVTVDAGFRSPATMFGSDQANAALEALRDAHLAAYVAPVVDGDGDTQILAA